MDYEQKYLKYKSKYLKLKQQYGGTKPPMTQREHSSILYRYGDLHNMYQIDVIQSGVTVEEMQKDLDAADAAKPAKAAAAKAAAETAAAETAAKAATAAKATAAKAAAKAGTKPPMTQREYSSILSRYGNLHNMYQIDVIQSDVSLRQMQAELDAQHYY